MRNKGSLLKELPFLVVVALVASLLIKSFLVQFFYIPSGSMENTLQVQDRVAVNKIPFISKSIDRGDVVVFRDPDDWLPEIVDYDTNKYLAKVKSALVAVVPGIAFGTEGFFRISYAASEEFLMGAMQRIAYACSQLI